MMRVLTDFVKRDVIVSATILLRFLRISATISTDSGKKGKYKWKKYELQYAMMNCLYVNIIRI